MGKLSFLLLSALVATLSFQDSRGASIQEACTAAKCQLPECRCAAITNPLSPTPANQIPQIVYLTFDDAITVTNIKLYDEIFTPTRKNPNGARISGTFFVCHEYNDYTLTNRMWREGHEIALHSISHKADINYWKNLPKDEWVAEFREQIPQLSEFAQIPENELKNLLGMRVPFLQGGGDNQYEGLFDPDPATRDIWYDSTRPTWNLRPVLFPYTADYDTIQDCQIQPCPIGSYPGFWVSPLVDFLDANNSPCAFADTCVVPGTADEVYTWFVKNFNDHYNGRRAPFGIYTHATWLMAEGNEHIKEAYLRFIDYVLALPGQDAYIVSVKKGLQWQQYPATAAQIKDGSAPSELLNAWSDVAPIPDNCDFKNTCIYSADKTPPGLGERVMTVCGLCPVYYPWLNNNMGVNPY